MVDFGAQTTKYNNLLEQSVKNLPDCEVSLGLVNSAALDSLVLLEENIAPISSKNIIEKRNYDKSYATLEDNLYLLDGSMVLPKKETTYVFYKNFNLDYWTKPIDELGYISDAYNLAEYEIDGTTYDKNFLEFSFPTAYDFNGLQITWSELLNEYATEFDIEYTNDLDVTETINVVGNEKVKVSVSNEFENIVKIKIIVKQWNVNSRRMRFEQIEIGTYVYYNNVDIKDLTITNESNPFAIQLPSNQVRFTIVDKEDKFNPDNPDGSYKYLTLNSPIDVTIKEKVFDETTGVWEELDVVMGKYFLSDWDDSTEGMLYTFTGKDVLGLIDSRKYYKGQYYSAGISAKDLIEDVIDDANLPSTAVNMFDIDSSLETKLVYEALPVLTHRQCIQMIANSMSCTIKMKRDGTIYIGPVDNTQNNYTLNGNIIHEKFPKPKIKDPVKGVECSIHTLKQNNATEQILQEDLTFSLASGENTMVILRHGFITNGSLQIVGISGVYIDYVEYYAYATIVSITGFTGTGTFTLTGKKVEHEKALRAKDYKENGLVVNPNGQTISINNEIITVCEYADALSTNVLNESLNRNTYSLYARADLRLEPMDMIYLQTKNTPQLKVRVMKVQYIYGSESGLQMYCELRGGNY